MQLTNLTTKYLGRNFAYFKKLDSTQNEIWRLIEANKITNGQLVMADIQTNGKGTHGRIWHTDEEKNMAFSVFIKTNCIPMKLDRITIEIAETLVDIFKDRYNIQLEIKSPNDLVYNGKKLGGILTESKINSEKIKYLIIGIGINTEKLNFTEDIKDIATSIKKEFNIEVDRLAIIAEFCNRFENLIERKISK